ncbi:MAG: threonine ammonia-lyase [Pseudomonadota bacterium]
MADQSAVRAPQAPAVDFGAIQAAAARLAGQIERTPTRHSRTLSEITGAEVWVKFENLQFTASFKERGALNKLMQLTAKEKKQGVIAASAGNHSQGVAYHGRRLGVPVTIVMPKPTPFVKVQQSAHFGAKIVLEGENFDEAYEHALKLQAEHDLTFVHPFNDPDVIAGQGTVALEMLEDAPALDAIVCPIGGAGLIAGVATAAKHMRPDLNVYGVEPAMYPSFISRMRGNRARVGGSTIAEGIAVKAVGDLSYSIARPLLEDVLLIEEADFERAIALYCTIEKTIAEGAGAAALSALLAYPERFKGRKVGLILSGGNIDTRLLAAVLTRSLIRDGRIANLRFIGDDRPGLLANVSRVLGELGANIISVEHRRYTLDVPAKGAEFDIEIETRDAQHTAEIVEALNLAGYPPKRF